MTFMIFYTVKVIAVYKQHYYIRQYFDISIHQEKKSIVEQNVRWQEPSTEGLSAVTTLNLLCSQTLTAATVQTNLVRVLTLERKFFSIFYLTD